MCAFFLSVCRFFFFFENAQKFNGYSCVFLLCSLPDSLYNRFITATTSQLISLAATTERPRLSPSSLSTQSAGALLAVRPTTPFGADLVMTSTKVGK
jgi:hypothetical protein